MKAAIIAGGLALALAAGGCARGTEPFQPRVHLVTLTGIVTYPSGAPVARARVWLNGDVAHGVFTNASGRYSMQVPEPDLTVTVNGRDGFTGVTAGQNYGSREVEVRPSLLPLDVNLVLDHFQPI